jgi:hypothetical protein
MFAQYFKGMAIKSNKMYEMPSKRAIFLNMFNEVMVISLTKITMFARKIINVL